MQRDFSKKGVKFYYIYKALAHPETNGYITPFTLQERLMHVAEAKKKLGSRITWLCDTMANDAKHRLGDAPNSEFIIDPEGKFVKVRRWSRPEELRADLEALVGKVANPTSIADIGMPRLEPPTTAPKGIVARLQLPGRMTAVTVQPSTELALSARPGILSGGEPLYVKLRAEVDSEYFRNGAGKLYLGLFLDPLYAVHWNNQVAPVAYEIEAPTGVAVTPQTGTGPTVDEKADADPREFLLELSGESRDPIKLTIKYFACDDAETFCKPVTQRYLITLERDRDGGSRREGGFRRGGGRPAGGMARQNPSAGPGNRPSEQRGFGGSSLLAALDVNNDGKLSSDELASAAESLLKLDRNGDGQLSPDETTSPDEAMSTGERSRFGRPPGNFDRPGLDGRRPNPAEMLARMDANGDGKIAKSEVPQPMLQRWNRMDTDGDGFIDKQELKQLAERFGQSPGNRQRSRRPGND